MYIYFAQKKLYLFSKAALDIESEINLSGRKCLLLFYGLKIHDSFISFYEKKKNEKKEIFRDIHLMEIHLIITIRKRGREVERQRKRWNGKILGRG